MKSLLLSFLFGSMVSFSQDSIIEADTINWDTYPVVLFPDIEPQYPDGIATMLKFINENLVYPYINNIDNFDGKIYVSFVVDEKGKVRNIKIEKGNYQELNVSVIDMVKKMPDWIPGEQNGNKIATQVRIPLMIHLY